MAHVETVQRIYEAFGRGDVAGILAHLADDVDWEYGGMDEVPWLQPRRGRANVTGFFEALASSIDIQKFQPKTFLESGSTVVVLVDLEASTKRGGHPVVEEDEVHIWHFDATGKVQRFRHRADTHQHWLAAQSMTDGS